MGKFIVSIALATAFALGSAGTASARPSNLHGPFTTPQNCEAQRSSYSNADHCYENNGKWYFQSWG